MNIIPVLKIHLILGAIMLVLMYGFGWSYDDIFYLGIMLNPFTYIMP